MIFLLYSLFISISYGNPDWDENPIAAFMYTEADEVDRNGDGRIDLWIERDEKKRIIKLSFDSTYQFGKPVLRFHLDHLGNVIEREEVMLDANNKILSSIHATVQNSGNNSKSVSISHRDSKNELYREEWEILKNQTLRQTISQNNKQIQFDTSLAGAFDVDGFLANPATVCLGRSSSSRLTTTSVGRLMAQVDPATEVHSSCNNFKLVGNDGSADKGTALPPATIKSRLTGIINTGVQCMRNLKAADGTTPAHTPNRMADELLANVYARANNESAKKLNIRCDRPAARVNEAGYANNVMATTSNFADPEFPSIFLNRLPEERFDQTVFHELLHLSGTQGHQCLHRNNDAREMDRIQSCAACCFPIANSVTTNTDFKLLVPEIRSDEQLKQLSCNVCSGNLSVVDSMIAYAKTEIAQGGGTSLKYAAIELRKTVQLDPNNYEAWRLLGEVLNLFANPTDARQMRVVAALDQAAAHAPNEAARRSILASASYQRANRFSRTEAAGRLTTGNYLTRSASTADQDLALQYEKKRSLFLMTINSCGPHIETTSGPNCHDLATTHLAAMAQEYKLMAKKNSESKSAMYRPYNEETLTRMRNMIKTYRDVALPCLQNAGGSIQSCIGTDEFDGMREAAFP